jgi:hypothetical protein
MNVLCRTTGIPGKAQYSISIEEMEFHPVKIRCNMLLFGVKYRKTNSGGAILRKQQRNSPHST